MDFNNKSSKWLIAKKGFFVFFSLSLVLNILNIVLGPVYSPGFSGYYLTLLYLPLVIADTIVHDFHINVTDHQVFIHISLMAVILDGLVGALLGIGIQKYYKQIKYTVLFILFLIYWSIAAFAFRIHF